MNLNNLFNRKIIIFLGKFTNFPGRFSFDAVRSHNVSANFLLFLRLQLFLRSYFDPLFPTRPVLGHIFRTLACFENRSRICVYVFRLLFLGKHVVIISATWFSNERYVEWRIGLDKSLVYLFQRCQKNRWDKINARKGNIINI